MRARDACYACQGQQGGAGVGQEGAPTPQPTPDRRDTAGHASPRAVNSAPRCDETRGRTPFERAHSQLFLNQAAAASII